MSENIQFITPAEAVNIIRKKKGIFQLNEALSEEYGPEYMGYADGFHYIISKDTHD